MILDDSYNGSEHGIRAALAVLALFSGKKVVQTPGIVEQGKNTAESNFKLGRSIAKTADDVIIVNDINRSYIEGGLLAGEFNRQNIHFAKTTEEAKLLYAKLLVPGDALLIANDLPDNFA